VAGAGTDLGHRDAQGAIDNSGINPYGNGFYVATFDPKTLAVAANSFEVYHIALKGPAGSTVEVWVDQSFYETTPRGDINSWDPKQPLLMRGGQTLRFFWSMGGTPVPLVTVWLRQPLVS
jgi:hypothetical protein